MRRVPSPGPPPEVADEVLLGHASTTSPAGASVGSVQVRVEHDDGEGQDERRVGVGEGAGGVVAVVGDVALGEGRDEPVHLLGLSGKSAEAEEASPGKRREKKKKKRHTRNRKAGTIMGGGGRGGKIMVVCVCSGTLRQAFGASGHKKKGTVAWESGRVQNLGEGGDVLLYVTSFIRLVVVGSGRHDLKNERADHSSILSSLTGTDIGSPGFVVAERVPHDLEPFFATC